MLKQETLDYIIEKMRGGLPKEEISRFEVVPFLTDINTMLDTPTLRRDKLIEYFEQGVPMFKGKWKLDEKGQYSMPFPLGGLADKYEYRLVLREQDSKRKGKFTAKITLTLVRKSTKEFLFPSELFNYTSSNNDDIYAKEKEKALKLVENVFGVKAEFVRSKI